MLNDWQRLEKIVRWAGLSVNSFARSIGMERAENLFQIKRGQHGISPKVAAAITEKYPQISKGWLMTGEGEMFLPDSPSNKIPFFDVDVEKYVAAPDRFESCDLVAVPNVAAADFAAYYHGRAMDRSIPPGSIVISKRVSIESLVPGGEYIVRTETNTTLRRVRRKPGSDMIWLQADSEYFDDMEVEIDKISDLYFVCAVVVNKTV